LNIYHGLAIDGDDSCGGGGVFIESPTIAIITDTLIHDNTAGSNNPDNPTSGGGICTYGILTMNHSQVFNNLAYADGGGIQNSSPFLVLDHSQVFNNLAYADGGGIQNSSLSLMLNHSQVYENIASNNGGGIANQGYIEINDSTIKNNTCQNYGNGGGIFTHDGITLNRAIIVGNIAARSGGGIYGNSMSVNQSSLISNQAAIGGGIYSEYGDVVFNNSTAISNQANETGGGMEIRDLYVINSSILYNQAENGGGIHGSNIDASNTTIAGNFALGFGGGISAYFPPVLRNTILAENEAPSSPDCSNSIISEGYNIVGNTSGCTINMNTGDQLNVDSHFYRLYGWPQFMTLLSDSPAIDAGNSTGCIDYLYNPIETDQRGNTRPVDGNGDGKVICDIGAYEYDPEHLPRWLFLPLVSR
jgi:hypothetical protein